MPNIVSFDNYRKQKEVIRLEAMELDVEMAMIHNDSKMKLQQQVHVHVHVSLAIYMKVYGMCLYIYYN